MKPMPDDQAELFQRLRLCAERCGWLTGGKYIGLSTELFRRQITVPPAKIRDWFLGRDIPDPSVMPVLSDILRVSQSWLVHGVGDPLDGVPRVRPGHPAERSHIPVISPSLCYEWCNYLPVPANLPRITVFRLCHPRTFAFLVRHRKSSGQMRPQRHIIVSPMECLADTHGQSVLMVVCNQRKFHVGYLETVGRSRFLRSPTQAHAPIRLSFSHQLAGFVDPATISLQPAITATSAPRIFEESEARRTAG